VLKLIPALVAVALFASPALATMAPNSESPDTPAATAPAPSPVVCMTTDMLMATVPPHVKLIKRIEGDKLVKLSKIEDMPPTDLILLFSSSTPGFVNLQVFNKGCHVARGLLPAADVAEALGDPKPDDGKISAPPFMSHRPPPHDGLSGWDGKI